MPAGDAAATASIAVFVILTLIAAILPLAGMWAVFVKAGQPGWAAIIPIYNMIVLLRISGKPEWWVILLIIPCINIFAGLFITIVVAIELSNRFGRGGGFAVGLILLPAIFYPILGFGSAQYEGRRKLRRRKQRQAVRDIEDEEDDIEEGPVPPAISRSRRTEDIEEEEEDLDEPAPQARPRQRRAEDASEEIQRPTQGITPSRPKPPAAAPGTLRCPSCGVTLKPPASAAGKRLKCPKCQTIFGVPGG